MRRGPCTLRTLSDVSPRIEGVFALVWFDFLEDVSLTILVCDGWDGRRSGAPLTVAQSLIRQLRIPSPTFEPPFVSMRWQPVLVACERWSDLLGGS